MFEASSRKGRNQNSLSKSKVMKIADISNRDLLVKDLTRDFMTETDGFSYKLISQKNLDSNRCTEVRKEARLSEKRNDFKRIKSAVNLDQSKMHTDLRTS